MCDHKDCHCCFGWAPLDCKLEEFEASVESGAPPPLQGQHNLVGPLCTSSCPTQLHFSNKFPIYTFRLLQALFGHLCPLLLGHDRLFISSSLACFLAFQLCFYCLTIRLLSQLQINSIKHIGQAARK